MITTLGVTVGRLLTRQRSSGKSPTNDLGEDYQCNQETALYGLLITTPLPHPRVSILNFLLSSRPNPFSL